MDLSTRLSNDFASEVRRRGQNYYRDGSVRITRGSDCEVEARVRGSRNYEVSLDWDGGALNAFCDCPYTEGACKHVWATILAADARGYLSAAASAKELMADYGEVDDSYYDEEDLFPKKHVVTLPVAPPPPAWRQLLAEVPKSAELTDPLSWPAKRQIIYVVDATATAHPEDLALHLVTRDRKTDGSWSRQVALSLRRSDIARLPSQEDREILAALSGARETYYYGYGSYDKVNAQCNVPHALASIVAPLAARTGRCFLRGDRKRPDYLVPIAWDEAGPWQFGLAVRPGAKQGWKLAGVLKRGEERMELSNADLVTRGGLVFANGRVAPLAEDAPFEWIAYLRGSGSIEAPQTDQDELLAALLTSAAPGALEVPEELRYEEVTLKPRPGLRITAPKLAQSRLLGELSFDYDGRVAPATDTSRGFWEPSGRRFIRRDLEAERAAAALLGEMGIKYQYSNYMHPNPGWDIAPTKLPRVVRTLVQAGWHIEAEGKVFKRPGAFHMEVSSGVDWFELHGEVEYGETKAKLPRLLEALRKGEKMVRLDDGTYGVLPEEWLSRFGVLAGLGTPDTDHVRFRRSQVGLLDALLATQPEATCDETFARVRDELRLFQGIEPAPQPDGFAGQLRDYQREGLGWMQFLRRFSFGGCLADDMGVGKTAQVLALLETRRELRAAGEALGPSLVVVPRSLIFNWKQEAERFTPQLRVLDYTGTSRNGDGFGAYDLVLTTYGTLRRDAVRLKDVEFDYVVLDEAQAIKNAAAESSKAARLLRAGRRLALSGTPVQNHLGELWSLFEFLNPGMLGAASVFKLTGGAARSPDEDTRQLLAHALRPFILRRTKEQVARELPLKTEQTIYCEMKPAQRKLYDELRQHYRNSLLKRVETEGLAKSKIQVLEALLRLRQAACHPGLLDPKRTGEPSAKLETLIEQMREILDEGHKALVFSQFTSLLAIVRNRLDAQGIVYEYLDGATRDRQACVERFQNDPNCPLFLISLKAGGLGLNLTAAEYVFLLDPWWNPAVEAQAVDRAHRIGQMRQVFAYRLIARDTVEEKVLELQKSKRDLAAAIIGEDNSLIRDLRREDLELLLS